MLSVEQITKLTLDTVRVSDGAPVDPPLYLGEELFDTTNSNWYKATRSGWKIVTPTFTTGPVGPKGDTGDTGPQGAPGTNGTNGTNGLDGAVGVQGTAGVQGAPGAAGTPGTNGSNGAPGVNGSDGAAGAAGAQGPKGDKGDKGDPGTNGGGNIISQYCVDSSLYCAKDGVTDDSGALASAALAAKVAGTRLYISPGTYRIKATCSFPDGVKIIADDYAVMVCNEGDTTANMFSVGGDGTKITGGIWRNNRTSGNYITFSPRTNTKNLKFIDVQFDAAAGTVSRGSAFWGIVSGLKNIRFLGCRVYNMFWGLITNTGAENVDGFHVYDSEFDNIAGDGIEINAPGVASYAGPKNIYICRNSFTNSSLFSPATSTSDGCGFAIGVANGTHVTVTNNYVDGMRFRGIHFEDKTHNLICDHNTVINTARNIRWPLSNYNDGIYVQDCQYGSVSYNNCHNNFACGIELGYNQSAPGSFPSAQGGAAARAVNVIGNSCTYNGTYGISYGAQDSDTALANICKNVCAYNGASGARLFGNAEGGSFTGNILENNTGCGLEIGGNGGGWQIDGSNKYRSNVAGRMLINTGAQSWTFTGDSQASSVAIAGGTGAATVTTVFLGVRAKGTLTVVAQTSLGQNASRSWEIVSDGGSFVATPLFYVHPSVIDISGVVLSGKYAVVSFVGCGVDGTSLRLMATFTGVLYAE